MSERILRRKAVLAMFGFSSSTLNRRIEEGIVPPPLRLGPHSVGWRESTILSVIDSFEPVTVKTGKIEQQNTKTGSESRLISKER